MAYQADPITGDIIISGFDKGIGDSPFTGLYDLKSVNIGSVPGEVSVNFSTQNVMGCPSFTNFTVTAAGVSNLFTTTATPLLEDYQAISFSSSSISGVSTATTYYITSLSYNSGNGISTFSLSPTYNPTSGLSTGTTGTAVASTINMGAPKHFANMANGAVNSNFMLDANGRVWTDAITTAGGANVTSTSSWTYTNNNTFSGGTTDQLGLGNGLVYWRTSTSGTVGDWDGWLLIFRNGFIDYSNVNFVHGGSLTTSVGTYVYGWNFLSGGTTATAQLTGANQSGCPHNAIVGPDGRVYFCDYFNIRKINQTDLVTPTTFNPLTGSTFTTTTYNLLPINDIATDISPLGNNMIIGGIHNQAYQWDTVNNAVINAILLAEPFVSKIVTVNTNAYLFCGNRGNIYITNGSQANPWLKIPDHIASVSSPYFVWGGATYQKGKLYFGAWCTTNNSNTNIQGYGGLWEADINTKALCLSNKLSYGTYAGYPTALMPLPPTFAVLPNRSTNPAGLGMLIGWDNGAVGYGVDKTISTLYQSGQSYVISDAIPIGTFLKPTTPMQLEYKLTTPLLSGETVELQVAPYFNNGTFPTFTSVLVSNGDVSKISDNSQGIPSQAFQWILVKAILTGGTSATPSYNRLKELRIISR